MALADPIHTQFPEQDLAPPTLDLDDSLREAIELTFHTSLNQGLAGREGLDETLDYWDDLAEQISETNNDPWQDAASLCMPVVSSAINDVRARLMAALFVKQPYIIHGLSPEANGHQEEVSRYYNSLFYTKEFLQAHDDVINLICRDGTAGILVPWVKRIIEAPMIQAEPVLDEAGEHVFDSKGKKKYRTTKKIRRTVERNHVTPQAFELRDIVLSPASSRSPEHADNTFLKVHLDASDLWGMVENGDMWQEQVEKVLAYNRPGSNELAAESQGTSTYEMGGLINVTDSGSSSATNARGGDVAVRTNMSFWMVFSKSLDLEGSHREQRYVGWLHEQSHTLCGLQHFPYWHNRWPLVPFGLFRRANRFYHRGIPEMLRSLQEEANALENQGLNLGDMLLQAPRYHKRNVRIDDQGQQWGPGADYEVDDEKDIGLLMQGVQFPEISLVMRQELEAKAKMLVGVGTPGLGLPGGSQGGKMSSKQTSAWTMAQNVIIDMLAMNIRWSMKEVLEQTHLLTLQYANDVDDSDEAGMVITGGEKLHIPPEVLTLPFGLDVTGLTGGLDQEEQMTAVMTVYSLLRQDPLVSGDLSKWYYVVKMVLEQFRRHDIPEIIGTPEEAKQKQEQMAAQAEQDRQFQLAKAGHAQPSSNGKPGGGSAQPPPQQGAGPQPTAPPGAPAPH